MKPFCSACKHYRESFGPAISYAVCKHPDNKVFSRVHGPQHPYIIPPLGPTKDETLERCDEKGLFEKKEDRKRPWWLL